MKNPIRILAALTIIAALAVNYGCKEDDPTPLTLSTITVGGADLNGATSPTGVAPDASIEINLSTNVDASTATAANIKLTRDYDDADVPLTITPDGSKITVKPVSNLNSGNLYVLTIGEGLKSDKGLALTAVTRNFTTAGFFTPDGLAAYWMFENNGDDALGEHDSNNSIEITYVDGRNAAAGKAASFNGTTSVMEVPNGDDFLDSENFALSMWVKPDASNTHGHFVIGLAGFLGFQYEIAQDMSSAKLAARYHLANDEIRGEETWWNGEGLKEDSWVGWTFSKDVGGATGVKAIFTDKWTHVVCVYNASTKIAAMYLNGDKVKEFDFKLYPDDRTGIVGVAYAGNTNAPGNNLVFGFTQSISEENRSLSDSWAAYENVDNNHFKGQLDDVRIFKRAITATEIASIYNSEK